MFASLFSACTAKVSTLQTIPHTVTTMQRSLISMAKNTDKCSFALSCQEKDAMTPRTQEN